MNLIKMMAKKAMLILAIVILWILDDAAFFLPDVAVWSITGLILKASGNAERLKGLQEYWTGVRVK